VQPSDVWGCRVLVGRNRETDALDQQLARVRLGHGAVLVLRGEAGVGKTALLDYVAERASGCQIARATGVQSEMELAFAGLHQLCSPMLNGLDGLPGPQRGALRVAFGLQDGGAPDHFRVGLAVLSLLAAAAEVQPLVCLIDDAHWLDRASGQALAFVARRVQAERLALVFGIRDRAEGDGFAGLPQLVVEGLADSEAREVLASGVRGRLDERVGDRIVAEARGNPLALLELPRGLTPAELAGGFSVSPAAPLASRIEESFLRRVESLPAETRRLLLIAAAEPVGDVPLFWRAAQCLGAPADAIAPAEAAGLIEVRARVRFCHPLVRSAVYRAAIQSDCRAAHAALAEATDPDVDPDRRAWHRAHAAAGLDPDVADELERSAGRAQRRGGVAAAAAFLQRSAELTADPALRVARIIAAAEAQHEAGAPDAADALVATAELGPLDELQCARLQRLRAQIAFAHRRGNEALPLLLDAAKRLIPLDVGLAREAYLEALTAAAYAGRLSPARDVREVAAAARLVPPAPQSPGPLDLLADALATVLVRGYVRGVPGLRAALDAFRRDHGNTASVNRWLWLACRIASDLWDDEVWEELAIRGVRLARETGTLSVLPLADSYRAGVHVHAGEFVAASALMDDSSAIIQTSGNAPLIYTTPLLAAYRGEESRAVRLLHAARRDATARGQGLALSMIECSAAVLFNGLGRYEEALAAAERGSAHDGLGLYALALVELVEAGVRSEHPRLAAAALARLRERTQASGTDWALGMEARSCALLTGGPAAEGLYEEAINRLRSGRVALHLARARLVYGEWLRRENRRADARHQLRAAHDSLSRFGAGAFADRARRELLACGATARQRLTDTHGLLTPQEAEIARLVRRGHTNPEIGAQLFISPRTVEYHLRKVFAKLDVTSRRDLRHAFEQLEQHPGHAAAGPDAGI
jgi:DNA-binding CsgD family transcriptional regulator